VLPWISAAGNNFRHADVVTAVCAFQTLAPKKRYAVGATSNSTQLVK
jgi:hypothetical protein